MFHVSNVSFCALPFLCLSFQSATFGSAGDLWFSATITYMNF